MCHDQNFPSVLCQRASPAQRCQDGDPGGAMFRKNTPDDAFERKGAETAWCFRKSNLSLYPASHKPRPLPNQCRDGCKTKDRPPPTRPRPRKGNQRGCHRQWLSRDRATDRGGYHKPSPTTLRSPSHLWAFLPSLSEKQYTQAGRGRPTRKDTRDNDPRPSRSYGGRRNRLLHSDDRRLRRD